MSRFLAGTGLGLALGFAWWLQLSYRFSGGPDSLSFAVAVWGLIGGLIGFFFDLPIVPGSGSSFESSSSADLPPERPSTPQRPASTWPGVAARPISILPVAAPLPFTRAEPSNGLAWSTVAAAILLPATFFPAVPIGLAWCARGRAWMASEGTEFFWGLDALVALVAGLFAWLAGAALVGLAAASVVVAGMLLARSARGRTAALVLFLAAAGAALWSLLLFPAKSAPIMLAGALAGATLLCTSATSRDFAGRWGAILIPRRSPW